jgi:DNA-binding GntR family transcriptional regulator
MKVTERNEKETGREYALRILKENIVALELEPGSTLNEKEIAGSLGLSRTPVREAVLELAKGQLIEIYPQRGSHIALIDLELVEEARFVRQTIELAIVELSCEMMGQEVLGALSENVLLQEFYLEHFNPDKLMELDNIFHQTLFNSCKKTHTYSLLEGMMIHFDRVRTLSLSTIRDIKIVKDHRDILEAIKKRDKEEAKAAMLKHLSRQKLDEKEVTEKYPQYFKK